MRSPVVFLDIESTGLSLDDEITEVAAIRRAPSGTEATLHLFIAHDPAKCSRLPEPYLSQHLSTFPAGDIADHGHHSDRVASRAQAADRLALALSDTSREDRSPHRPHIVGAVPSFDTERVALLLAAHGYEPGWHYHLIDVENLAVGYLANSGGQFTSWHDIAPPYESEVLSRAVGVDPTRFDRHTALGDARWARAIYDVIVGDRQRDRDEALAAVESPLDR